MDKKLLDRIEQEIIVTPHSILVESRSDGKVTLTECLRPCKDCGLEVDRGPERTHRYGYTLEKWARYCKPCRKFFNPNTGKYDIDSHRARDSHFNKSKSDITSEPSDNSE